VDKKIPNNPKKLSLQLKRLEGRMINLKKKAINMRLNETFKIVSKYRNSGFQGFPEEFVKKIEDIFNKTKISTGD
jgi:hypothetical protein